MSDVWNAQFCVVLDDHLEDKIRNGKWWEDRGHKIGTVGQWLYLCTSSNSRFVPSSVVICGRVDRHEISERYVFGRTGRDLSCIL